MGGGHQTLVVATNCSGCCCCRALQFEKLYVEVLYTIKHRIGATTGGHLPYVQDLFLYAREAFAVTPEKHATLLARASEEKVGVWASFTCCLIYFISLLPGACIVCSLFSETDDALVPTFPSEVTSIRCCCCLIHVLLTKKKRKKNTVVLQSACCT